MILNGYTDVYVPDLVPRSSETYRSALQASFAINKLIAIASIVFIIVFIIVFLYLFKSSGYWKFIPILIFIILELGFLWALHKRTYGSLDTKVEIFEKGNRIEAKVIEKTKDTHVRQDKTNSVRTYNIYRLTVQPKDSDEHIELTSQHEILHTEVSEGSILIGILYNGQYLFGEENWIHFVKEE